MRPSKTARVNFLLGKFFGKFSQWLARQGAIPRAPYMLAGAGRGPKGAFYGAPLHRALAVIRGAPAVHPAQQPHVASPVDGAHPR